MVKLTRLLLLICFKTFKAEGVNSIEETLLLTNLDRLIFRGALISLSSKYEKQHAQVSCKSSGLEKGTKCEQDKRPRNIGRQVRLHIAESRFRNSRIIIHSANRPNKMSELRTFTKSIFAYSACDCGIIVRVSHWRPEIQEMMMEQRVNLAEV